MIKIHQLTHQYSNMKKIPFPDFKISKGEPLLLLGDSGSGKTTLLHLLGGLLKPSFGKIYIDETDITRLSESALDKFRANHIGFVFQKNHLISSLNVIENVLMAFFLAGKKKNESRIDEVLNQLGLANEKKSKVNQLSQGQAQRVAIARAIVNGPSVILADEPTSALDDTNCKAVINLLLQVSQENNATLVVATHDQRIKNQFSTSTLPL